MAKRPEIRSLTGLRGIAAVAVMVWHYSLVEYHPDNPLGRCYVAVDLFFILSGFVMAAVHAQDFAEGWSAPAYAGFLHRRFARVYPLYFVTTLTAFALSKFVTGSDILHPTRTLLTNLLDVQCLGPGLLSLDLGRSLDGPGWSISTELGAYLLFPWLAIALVHRPWRVAAAACVLALGSLTVIAVLPAGWIGAGWRQGPLDVSWGDTLWPLLRCLAGFSLGLVAYRVSRAPAFGAGRNGWVDAGVIGAMLLLWLMPGSDLLIVMVFLVLILQVCTDQSPLAHALGRPIPHALGTLSYAIYLVHYPALAIHPALRRAVEAAGMPYAETVSFAVLCCVVIAIAWLAFNVVERPLRRLFQDAFQRNLRPGLGDNPIAS